MFKVYVIRSLRDGRLYVGLSKDPFIRLRDHNFGRVFSTKGYRPWKLVYIEERSTRNEAREREKYLKSGIGKERLKLTLDRVKPR